jgi:NAD(P)-dependent dehydrogenase (short-subunit alcohol dehydrogenase family)
MPSTGVPATQAPIHSGFGPTTTVGEVLEGNDLTGKVAIVTGGYAGIGLETTRALAKAGATVIVPARTQTKHVGLSAISHGRNRADWTYLIPVPSMASRVSFLPAVARYTSSSTTLASWLRR